jgi:hypothetical protein
VRALWSPHGLAPWADCEILGSDGCGSYVVRELGRVFPGVAVTAHVRLPAGVVFRPPIRRRGYLPAGFDRWSTYRRLREALGRDAALRAMGLPVPLDEPSAGESP